ncbi:hypothetical protein PFICI_08360 [Pestalotiopsis fici W106-1]|uniref:Uncharacterized protein n=1 Tax=Pestalotiopsis fici (strain W106-1 / CGMCC3.15140) TaxID=1229662 RepID=W3X6M9_PESFW|nr:uncharacterized protein PFICI_08360 [Pestalotiopsis fici W106-1]ETS80831.1 hypothetical protein PFICI_08360 [Pestalotiopsis fici W106-1]
MSDRPWLPFGQRPRDNSSSRSPSSPPSSHHSGTLDSEDNRRPGPSRTTSLLSLGSLFPLSLDTAAPSTRTAEADLLVNDADRVWHRPSTLQMLESLQVSMMSRRADAPIPLEHNAYVLHLIEAFRGMQAKINTANSAREEAQLKYTRMNQDLQAVRDEWAKREEGYRADIKRLELIIARDSRDGLKAVTLARANSVVDRQGPNPQQFIQKLEIMRNQEEAHQPNPVRHFDGVDDDNDDFSAFLGHAQLARADTSATVSYMEKDGRASTGDPSGRFGKLSNPFNNSSSSYHGFSSKDAPYDYFSQAPYNDVDTVFLHLEADNLTIQ